jgi:hypothetical protein
MNFTIIGFHTYSKLVPLQYAILTNNGNMDKIKTKSSSFSVSNAGQCFKYARILNYYYHHHIHNNKSFYEFKQ